MLRLPLFNTIIGGVMLLASCGGQQTQKDEPCWPLDASPGGQVEIGTGDVTFQPMPDTLAIIRSGGQADPYLEVHSRIHGFPPGDPNDVFNPANPKTKVSAVIPELNLTLGVECPASLGYVASSESDAFDMVHSLHLGFGLLSLDQFMGKQAQMTIEVVGSNGLYAQDQKQIMLLIPVTPPDAGVPADGDLADGASVD